MKTITCKAMGGPCDAPITGNTAEELMNNGMAHVNANHPELAASMKTMPKEETDKWAADYQKTWDATPETV